MNYWERCHPTYIENWPAALCSLSIPSIDIPLSIAEAKRLGSNIIEFGFEFGQREGIDDIRVRVADAVDQMPNGAFIRLGSRSPKDSWSGHRDGLQVKAGEDPLRFILDASERMYEDLTLAIQHDYPPHIFVRQWMVIPRWTEFRCFMRDHKLVGISQYNYLQGEVFPEIVQDSDTIRWVIESQFFPGFRDASHLPSVVFDVAVQRSMARDNTRVWQVRLLEINPFFELTDPCLFAWKDGFDGSFRYNTSATGRRDYRSVTNAT